MSRVLRSLFAVFWIVALSGQARAQEGDDPAEGPEANPKEAMAVVLATGDSGSEQIVGMLAQSLGQVAEERGYTLVDPDRVDSFVGAMERQPESEEDLAGVGRLLGANAVLHGTLRTAASGDLTLTVRAVFPFEGSGGFETRMVTGPSALAQARAMARKILPPAGDEAMSEPPPVVGALPVAPEMAREDPPEAAPTAIPAVPRANSQTPAREGGGAIVIPGGHRAPARPSTEELERIPEGRQLAGTPTEAGRVVGTAGVAAGVQGGLWMVSLMVWIGMENRGDDNDYKSSDDEDDEERQRATEIGYFYLAISPALSSLAAWGIGNGSDYYDSKWGPIVAGSYVGSTVALGLMLLANYTEVPELVPYGYFIGPILLPAVGAALGYAIGREPEKGVRKIGFTPRGLAVALSDGVEWILPQPVVAPSMDRSRGAYVGISLGTVRF